MGRQSDSNVERTLGHVEPTMGGVVTDMSSKIRSIWESLERRGMAPLTFGKISSEAWEFIAHMILPLPEFKFLHYCLDSEWKLKEWCKINYSSWTRNHGIRQSQVKKTENVEDVLNSSKLLRMDTPHGKLNMDNIGSKHESENSEEDNDDSGLKDEDDEAKTAPLPVRQQVRPTLR